jgi:DNA-binding Lrp family transcriptional regulator
MGSGLDAIDETIMALLREDGRRSVADIAARVALSPTAVKRRLERLERTGVITGYGVQVDHARMGWTVSAFVALRFAGKTTPEEMHRAASRLAEVSATYTTAGDEDLIALVHATSLDHLRDVIAKLRSASSIISTRTHVVLDANVKSDWHPPMA